MDYTTLDHLPLWGMFLATIAFVLVSSVLFFAAFCQIAPGFYAARRPLR